MSELASARARRVIEDLGGLRWMDAPVDAPPWLSREMPSFRHIEPDSSAAFELFDEFRPYLIGIAAGISQRIAHRLEQRLPRIMGNAKRDRLYLISEGQNPRTHVLGSLQENFMFVGEDSVKEVLQQLSPSPNAQPYLAFMSRVRKMLYELVDPARSRAPTAGGTDGSNVAAGPHPFPHMRSDETMFIAGTETQAKNSVAIINEVIRLCELQFPHMDVRGVKEVALRSHPILRSLATLPSTQLREPHGGTCSDYSLEASP